LNRLATRLAAFILAGIIQLAGFSIVCYGESGALPERPMGGSPETAYPGLDPASTFWMVAKVIFFLLVIIGIFFAIVKFLSQKNKIMFGRSLRSLGGVPLGQNKSIQVVEIGRSIYIVGVGENVQLLEKIDDQEEVAYLTDMLTNRQMSGPNMEAVSGWWNKLLKKEDRSEEADITASFQQVFHDKMQHLSDRKKMADEVWTDDKTQDRLNDKQ